MFEASAKHPFCKICLFYLETELFMTRVLRISFNNIVFTKSGILAIFMALFDDFAY